MPSEMNPPSPPTASWSAFAVWTQLSEASGTPSPSASWAVAGFAPPTRIIATPTSIARAAARRLRAARKSSRSTASAPGAGPIGSGAARVAASIGVSVNPASMLVPEPRTTFQAGLPTVRSRAPTRIGPGVPSIASPPTTANSFALVRWTTSTPGSGTKPSIAASPPVCSRNSNAQSSSPSPSTHGVPVVVAVAPAST